MRNKSILFFLFLLSFSVKLSGQVLKAPVLISAAEYFFDTDPGAGSGTAIPIISAQAIVSLENVEIDISSLKAGFHKLYIRVKDESNFWGIPRVTQFYVPKEKNIYQITNAEILIDSPKAFGSGIDVPINTGEKTEASFELDLESNNISAGFHKLYVRVKDESGQWGNFQKTILYLPKRNPIRVIDKAEYFYDGSGQPGTGIAVAANGSPETGLVSISDLEIDAPEKEGFHKIMFRLGDDSGAWGIPVQRSLYQPKNRKKSALVEAEYFINDKTAIGAGTSHEIIATSAYSGQIDLPLSDLKTGFSKIYLRLKDEDGVWGNYVSGLVFKNKAQTAKAKIKHAEYFLSGSARPNPGAGFALSSASGSTSFDSVIFSSKALVTLTQTGTGKQAVYVRAEDTDGVWGVPTPASVTISNQRDFQGQAYNKGEFLTSGSAGLYKDGSLVSSTPISDFGLFTFQSLAAGSYEVQLNQSTTKKLGVEIAALGSTGEKTISSADQELISADIHVSEPLHVIATNPTPYFSRLKSTDFIEISFSSKFIPSSINSENIHLVSDLRGELAIQINKQNNDSVLTIKPSKSLLANEKVTLLVDATYQSQTNLAVAPYTTHFRAQVTGGGTDAWEEIRTSIGNVGNTGVAHFTYGDWDGDNDIDLAVMLYSPNSVVFYSNDGNGNFTKGSTLSLSTVNSTYLGYIFTGDYNRDGFLDFGTLQVYGNNYIKDGIITLFSNDGKGVFTEKYSLNIKLRSTAYEPMVGFYQLDYDGYPEIVVQTGGEDTGVIVIHNKAGVFSSDTIVSGNITILTKNTSNLTFGDFTGDGMIDYLIGNVNYNQADALYIGQNNSIGTTLSNERTFSKNIITGAYYYLAEDLNRDSKLDLAIFTNQGIYFYQDDAKDSISYLAKINTANHYLNYSIKDNFTVGDIDADGKLDVISLQNGTSTFNYFNVSQDAFDYRGRALQSNSSVNLYPKLIDLNRDGALDLFYLSRGNTSTFDLTVQINKSVPTNNAPVVANIIADLDMLMSQDSMEVDIKTTFSDPDSDDLIFSVQSSNSDVIRVKMTGEKVVLFPESIGNATITLTADDNRGKNVSTNFIVYVNASDNYTPRVKSPISDVSTRIADDSTTVLLATVFSDPDTGDVLTFTTTNPNTSVANVYIHNNSTLVISPLGLGTITINLTASDGKASAQNTFTVTVGPRENRNPTSLIALPYLTVNLGDAAVQIDPTPYFSDPDGDVLTYSVSAEDPTIAGGSYNSSTNKILITGAKAGTTLITITAQDPGGKFVGSQFTIFVNAKPRLIANLSEVLLILGGQSASFQLTSLFVDDNFQTMTYEVNSANPSIASISVSGTTLSFFAIGEGTTTATIKAKDPTSESATVTINVNVKTQNFAEQTSNSTASAYVDGIPVQDWCLLSIPGYGVSAKPVDLFTTSLGGSSDFKLFSLNQNGEYADVSTEAGPVFSSGNALWFKTLATKQKFTLQTPAGKRITSRKTEIVINQWMFISNPYEIEASWSISSSNLRLWKFLPNSKSWSAVSESEKLKPWNGYVAYMPGNGVLTISLDKLTATGVPKIAKSSREENTIAMQADILVGSNKLSVIDRMGAESDYDYFDEPLLPSAPDAKIASAYFKTEIVALSQDVRATKSSLEEQVLDFRTLVVPSGNTFITWNSVYKSDNFVMALVNESTYRILAPGDSVKLSKSHKKTEYKVYFGTKEMIETHVLPETHQLFDNFPNPFNPTSTIRFALNKAGNVTLNVYDVLGRKVSTLVRANLSQGYHTVQFDGVNLASGVYLYRLQVDESIVATKKMTLIK